MVLRGVEPRFTRCKRVVLAVGLQDRKSTIQNQLLKVLNRPYQELNLGAQKGTVFETVALPLCYTGFYIEPKNL